MRGSLLVAASVLLISILVIQYEFFAPDLPRPAESCGNNELGDEDYAIYRQLLIEFDMRAIDRTTILEAETVTSSIAGEDFHAVDVADTLAKDGSDVRLSSEALENFLLRSPNAKPLDYAQFKDLPITIASRAEIEELFVESNDAWDALGNSQIIRFSRVGFNCDKTQGLLYVSASCGWLCGKGELTIVERETIGWNVVFRQMLWIS